MDTVEEESREKELKLNTKKDRYNVVSWKNVCPQINMFINGNKLKQRDSFKYLSTLISINGCKNTEIAPRIGQVKMFSEKENGASK